MFKRLKKWWAVENAKHRAYKEGYAAGETGGDNYSPYRPDKSHLESEQFYSWMNGYQAGSGNTELKEWQAKRNEARRKYYAED